MMLPGHEAQMEASCASNHVAIEEGVLQGLGLLHGGGIKDKMMRQ